MADEEWNLVGSGGRIVRKGKASTSASSSHDTISPIRAPQTLPQGRKTIAHKLAEMDQADQFLSSARSRLEEHLDTLITPTTRTLWLVTYGIGRIFQTRMAETQMAFLLRMCEWVQVWMHTHHPTCALTWQLFDPVLTSEEKAFAQEKGFEVLEIDEECRRSVEEHDRAIFFMPHGEAFMYANLIDTNRSSLHRLVILGNSFRHYDESCVQRQKRKIITPLLRALPRVEEHPFPAFPFSSHVFNNTCFISFRANQ